MEMKSVLLFVVIGFVGIMAFSAMVFIINLKLSQYKYLKIFRNNLKRGEWVRVRGYEEKQRVWVNFQTGKILLWGDDGKFPPVKVTDVYPWNTKPEKWLR